MLALFLPPPPIFSHFLFPHPLTTFFFPTTSSNLCYCIFTEEDFLGKSYTYKKQANSFHILLMWVLRQKVGKSLRILEISLVKGIKKTGWCFTPEFENDDNDLDLENRKSVKLKILYEEYCLHYNWHKIVQVRTHLK